MHNLYYVSKRLIYYRPIALILIFLKSNNAEILYKKKIDINVV